MTWRPGPPQAPAAPDALASPSCSEKEIPRQEREEVSIAPELAPACEKIEEQSFSCTDWGEILEELILKDPRRRKEAQGANEEELTVCAAELDELFT